MRHPLPYVTYRALTSPLRMMPDFIIFGTVRGGTTAFYHHLAEHPSIAVSPTKELKYFNRHYYKGPWWYRAHFPTYVQRHYSEVALRRPLLAGEASPDYLFHPLAPERIARVLPHVKLIALLRNPVERAYSQYRLYAQLGAEPLTFEEAIASEEQRLRNGEHDDYNYVHYSYLARGRYAEQLEHWLRVFPREQLLLLRSEDFYADPASVLQQALRFLHLPLQGLPTKAHYERYDSYLYPPETRGERGMSARMREYLHAYFAPHNQRLYALIGRDMGWERAIPEEIRAANAASPGAPSAAPRRPEARGER